MCSAEMLGNPQLALTLLAASPNGMPFDCPVCKFIVLSLVQRLQDPVKRQVRAA